MLTCLFIVKTFYLLLLLSHGRTRSSFVSSFASFDMSALFCVDIHFLVQETCCELCCVLDECLCGTQNMTLKYKITKETNKLQRVLLKYSVTNLRKYATH
jgi:hypothetical protein